MSDNQWRELKRTWEDINDNMERIERFLENMLVNVKITENMLERWIGTFGTQ
jgi:hypothetical protein